MRLSFLTVLLLCSCGQQPRPQPRNIEEIPVSIRGIYQIESIEFERQSVDMDKMDRFARKWVISENYIFSIMFPEMDPMYGFVLSEDDGKCLLTMKSNDKGTGPNAYSLEYTPGVCGLITFRGSNINKSEQMKVVMKRLSSDYGMRNVLKFSQE